MSKILFIEFFIPCSIRLANEYSRHIRYSMCLDFTGISLDILKGDLSYFLKFFLFNIVLRKKAISFMP